MSSSSDEDPYPEGIFPSTEVLEKWYNDLLDPTLFEPHYPSRRKDKNKSAKTTEVNGEKTPEEEIDTSKLDIRFVDQT